MGVGIIVLCLIGLILLILAPFAYYLLNKAGYKKSGIVVAAILYMVVLLPSFSLLFESQLYMKLDAKEDLATLGFELADDFEILENDIVGVADYHQTTRFLLSSEDIERIINDIQASDNFKKVDELRILSDLMGRRFSEKIIWNYAFDGTFVRESYKKEEGYAPVEVVLTVRLNSDTLELRKIMD
ncbi:hypothetical protein O3Q51_09625 [Cryomorphaceae bacterium 1068]|nr:hypothetical protein [Cryomorphaceae bacterium 1068]